MEETMGSEFEGYNNKFQRMIKLAGFLSIFLTVNVSSKHEMDMSIFTAISTNVQFNQSSTIMSIVVPRIAVCILECHALGTECGSFSFSEKNVCSLSALRFNKDGKNSSPCFIAATGTTIYSKIPSKCFNHIGTTEHHKMID